MKTLRIYQLSFLLAPVLLSGIFLIPNVAAAQMSNECSFSRTLEMNVDGEDVRCLQKFLNKSGFIVAATGPGSVGNETSLFRTLTKEALVKWQQAKKVNPPSGVFGPQSQAAYLLALIEVFENKKIESASVVVAPAPGPQVAGVSTSATEEKQSKTEVALEKVLQLIKADDKNPTKARTDFYKALQSFFDGDYDKALLIVETVSVEVKKEIDSATKSDANKAVQKAQDAYDEAEVEIDDMYDDGEDVDEAEDYLQKANKYIKRADIALDKEDWSEAADLAKSAKAAIEDALDSVDGKVGKGGDEDDAEEAIDDAWDEYKDVVNDVEEAEEDGEDMNDAWDYLDEAKDLLKEADDAFDDEDYKEVLDLIDDALDALEEAKDEL